MPAKTKRKRRYIWSGKHAKLRNHSLRQCICGCGRKFKPSWIGAKRMYYSQQCAWKVASQKYRDGVRAKRNGRNRNGRNGK